MASPLHLLGKSDIAARLIGAAEAVLDTLGASRGPADQPVHDRTRTGLIAALGGDRFDELVAEGKRMTLADAVELALGGKSDR